jgi:hypothetical protein
VRTYLSVYPDHFYRITETDRGLLFVTARGWEDMSLMLYAMAEDGGSVDAEWCLQYLQDDGIARSFALYYDLFSHLTDRIQTEVGLSEPFSLARLLTGQPSALSARTSTECLAIAAMLFHPIEFQAQQLAEAEKRLARRTELAAMMPGEGALGAEEGVRAFLERKREALAIKVAHRVVRPEEEYRERSVLAALEEDAVAWLKLPRDGRIAFSAFEGARIEAIRKNLDRDGGGLCGDVEAAYRVLEQCLQGRSALLYLTSDLAASEACAALLAEYSSTSFERYRSQIEV